RADARDVRASRPRERQRDPRRVRLPRLEGIRRGADWTAKPGRDIAGGMRLAVRLVLTLLLIPVVACGGDDSAGSSEPAGWRVLRSAGLERTEVGAARIGDSIYVVGGFLPPDWTTAAVERFDIARNRWQRLAPMPIAVNHPAV